MKNIGSNQSSIRFANQMLIIREIQKYGILSRSELAENLSLSNPSISKNIESLKKIGILVEVGSAITNIGRRPVMLKINNNRGCIAVIDFSHGENIKVCLSDLVGNFFKVVKLDGFHTINTEAIESTIYCLRSLLRKYSPKCGNLLAICIGCPGIINPGDGKIIYATQIENYSSLDLRGIFKTHFSVNVIVKNDINLAVIGERYFGCGVGHRNIMYVNVGRGLGAGIILNDVLLEGFHGYAGEIGQCTVEWNNTENVTLSQTVSFKGMLEKICQRFDEGCKTVLRDMVGKSSDIDFEHIKKAISENDPLCCEVVGQDADILAWSLVGINRLLDLELIVLGGVVTGFGDFYLNRFKRALERCEAYNLTDIAYSNLDDLAVIYGGVYQGIQCAIENLLNEH